jgi:hypothetical protein
LGAVALDEVIPIDGKELGPLAAAGFEQAKALVSFVDRWMSTNKA